jgi:phosphoglucosamine mutase
LLKSVRFSGAAPLEADAVKAAISEAEARLGASGRIVIRRSGTEPVIRVMAEGEDQALVAEIVESICVAVQAA